MCVTVCVCVFVPPPPPRTEDGADAVRELRVVVEGGRGTVAQVDVHPALIAVDLLVGVVQGGKEGFCVLRVVRACCKDRPPRVHLVCSRQGTGVRRVNQPMTFPSLSLGERLLLPPPPSPLPVPPFPSPSLSR